MLSSTDHDKLQQIIQEHPETEELFNRIFKSHQMDISTISHEIRNPLQHASTYRITTSRSTGIRSLVRASPGHRIYETVIRRSVFL